VTFAVLPINVVRQSGSGMFGTVLVNYTTLSPTEYYSFLPSLAPSQVRADYLDFSAVSGGVTLGPGQLAVSFNLTIKRDLRSRPDAVLFTRLTAVTLLQGQQQRTGQCFIILILISIDTNFLFDYAQRFAVG
jgi:hypothetical protein